MRGCVPRPYSACAQFKGEQATNLGPSSRACPFHALPNVVMSPHRGANADAKARDRISEVVSMLETLAATGVMPNRFDIDRGY